MKTPILDVVKNVSGTIFGIGNGLVTVGVVASLLYRKSNSKKNDSIENQISIIRSYIDEQKDFQGAEIVQFIDDGFSGINVNRNAFQELLSKVRMREIDVIVVKDLSRLGRNYLDVCRLTDSILPFMKVRLMNYVGHPLSGIIDLQFPMNFFPYKVEADDLHDKCNDP